MKIFAAILCLCFFSPVIAQDVVTDSAVVQPAIADTTTSVSDTLQQVAPQLTESLQPSNKKFNVDRVRILLGVNYSFFNPVAIEKDVFNGSYYPVADSSPVWTDRDTKRNVASTHSVRNIGFNLQANFWKGLFIGMNYQFFSIRQYKKDVNLGNLLSKVNSVFFMVSADFGYVFEFLKNKSLQLEPSVRIGGYTADDYYDRGTGHKFYFGADIKLRYLIKRKFGFSIGADYDFLRYKKKGFSDIFQRNTYQKTTFSNIHLNAGICYNITIRTQK